MLLLQSLNLLVTPHARAATLAITPTEHVIEGGREATSTVDVAEYENLSFTFNYNTASLEDFASTGDSLIYGWRDSDGSERQLGIIEGETNSGGEPGEGETGSRIYNVRDLSADPSTGVLTFYFRNTGGSSDMVTISNVTFSGTMVDTVEPVVTSVQVPVGGTYSVGSTLEFFVEFSENIGVMTTDGTPTIELAIGSEVVDASYVSGSDSTILRFVYQVKQGDFDSDGITVRAIDLNGGTIRDAANNLANLTLHDVGSTANIFIDTAPPAIIASGGEVIGSSAILSGSSDDSMATYLWELVSVTDAVRIVQPTSSTTEVQLVDGQYGSYIFQLKARDSVGNETISGQIEIVFLQPPLVPGPSIITTPFITDLSDSVTDQAPLAVITTPTTRLAPMLSNANTRVYSNTELLRGSGDEGEVAETETTFDTQTATAITRSEEGWKLWGVAWYWYGLAGAVGVFLWWLINPLIRRPSVSE